MILRIRTETGWACAMDNSESLHDQILASMDLKTTEELLQIWVDNDRGAWTDTAFEVVRGLLIQRTHDFPPEQRPYVQPVIPPEHRMEDIGTMLMLGLIALG